MPYTDSVLYKKLSTELTSTLKSCQSNHPTKPYGAEKLTALVP